MVAKKVKEVLKKYFGIMRVDNDMLLLQDLGMEPIEVLEILRTVEEKIGVRMPSENIWERMEWGRHDITVADLIDFVEVYAPSSMVTPPKLPQTIEPVAGLYAITHKGTPICCVTGRKCNKLSKDQIENNGQLANLCKAYRCEIEHNFQNLAQKVK